MTSRHLFLLLGCFMLMHPVIVSKTPQHFMPGMSQPRKESTTREHPNASSYCFQDLYGVRVFQGGVFTPLVFSSSGGMSREARTFYRRLADLISSKQSESLDSYSVIMNWVRTRLLFSILRSSIMCIRGTCSSFTCLMDLLLQLQRVISPLHLNEHSALNLFVIFLSYSTVYGCIFMYTVKK